MKEKVLSEIREALKEHSPNLMDEQKLRMYKIINPDTSNYIIYGLKIATIEKIIKEIDNKYKSSYPFAVEIFKELSKSNIEEQKFAGLFYLNRYKKFFNINTINVNRKFLENISKNSIIIPIMLHMRLEKAKSKKVNIVSEIIPINIVIGVISNIA